MNIEKSEVLCYVEFEMKIVSFIALFGIMLVAVLGFVAMNDKHGNGQLCLSTVVAPAGCPEGPTLSKTFFHSGIYLGFSSGLFLAALVLLFLALTFALKLDETLKLSLLAVAEAINAAQPSFLKQTVRWLKFHEKRDPAAT